MMSIMISIANTHNDDPQSLPTLLLYYHKVAYTSLFVLLGVTDNIADQITYIVI